ncbi:ras GTPase-activating protein-binding protein 2-like [Sitodiplosis mosellana]|uniref:ras GTPase-activating protein-binding protein 2-like n=1 Tax=Sitodiplosis mosellana TaxID=263140 RepID=UPI002444DF66|nr:ras GTPase-activating protein-binding protein 2-like [Sitodiplosis mosellana]
MENTAKCMPTPPKRVGREFVRQYYTILNKSPGNLHCFYSEEAKFIHEDVNPAERRTIEADGKRAIRNIMIERSPNFKHTSTKIHTVDTIETLDDGLLVQVNGEISYNEQPMRPFSQTIILIPKSPFQYFVQNDIFRFCDYESYGTASCSNSVTGQTMQTAQPDWGTQCEEEDIEPCDGQMAKQAETRVDSDRDDGDAHENEVKLDTSDSGLSSDAEKAIMDIQSHNLKSILQESRSITKESVMKRGPTPPVHTENEPAAEADVKPVEDTNRTQLFRDSCILTIGNVINPNIEFDDAKCDQNASLENERTQESADKHNASKSDDNSSGKVKYRKRKDKRKVKHEMSKDKLLDESVEKVEPNQSSENNVMPKETVVQSESSTSENTVEKTSIDESSELTTSHSTMAPSEQEMPKTIPEMKTYADLAKAGKAEWIDELAARRDSTDRNKIRPMLVRRSSRTERTTPSHDAGHGSRSSPKNDQLQVFIGNIPHTASEDDIRRMFSRFGRLSRVRLHSNSRKEWLPRYAFISFDNIQSVKDCLMKKATFYWPENAQDGQKLNVNGDPTVDIWDDSGNQRSSEPRNRSRDLKQFSRNFVLEGNREPNNKQSPDSDANISDSVKSERRKTSTRA